MPFNVNRHQDCWWKSYPSKPTQYALSFVNLPSDLQWQLAVMIFSAMIYGGRKDLPSLSFCLYLTSRKYVITFSLVKKYMSFPDRQHVTSHTKFTVTVWLQLMFTPLSTYNWLWWTWLTPTVHVLIYSYCTTHITSTQPISKSAKMEIRQM